MSELQLVFWGVQSVIIFVILFFVLLIILWIVNRWILKGKIRLLYRILLSIGIPLALIGYDYYSIIHSLYSSSAMDERLEEIGAGIKLPPYEITSYKNQHEGGDDFCDTYQMVFKEASIKSYVPTLDSVCKVNENWEKRGNKYIFHTSDFGNEFLDTLIVRPDKGTATFVRIKY